VDGSAACDYDRCAYECSDPPPEGDDYSTYDVLYAGDVIFDAINAISNIYRQNNSLNFEDILARAPEFRPKYLIMALEYIITHKIPLRDRFGYTSYLREDNSYFYLDRSYPTGVEPAYAMAYYTNGVIGVKQESLYGILGQLEAHEYDALIQDLEQMDPSDPQFTTRLDTLPVGGQIVVVEDSILKSVRDGPSPFTEAVRAHFANMIFEIRDPLTELHKYQTRMAQHKPKRGRKPKPENKIKIKRVNAGKTTQSAIEYDTDTEFVFLHNLYSQVGNETGYGRMARLNKAENSHRILKPSEVETGWRDLNENEIQVYNIFIQLELENRKRPFEEQGLYGIILSDRILRILDRTKQKGKAKTDRRWVHSGKSCTTWARPELVDLMWKIEVPEVSDFMAEALKNKPTLIQSLRRHKNINHTVKELEQWPLNRLVYYAKLYNNALYTRDLMCDMIQQRLAETGRIFRS
jgi:hypothetical protein